MHATLRRLTLTALTGALLVVSAQAPQPKASQKTEDAFLTGKPLTLAEIVEAAPVIFEGRLRQAIQARGVDFAATAEALEQLRKAGVPEDLLKTITRLAPAPPSPPPPKEPPPAGPLTLECSPAECEVMVNGVSQGVTQGGAKQISGLRPGRVFVDFRKEGYEGDRKSTRLNSSHIQKSRMPSSA